MSQRTEQISSVIRAAVQNLLIRGLNDPRIRGLISVTRVDVTADLAEARVHVSVLPASHSELTMHGLNGAARWVQREIAKQVTTKRMPRISFRLDESLKRQGEIDAALAQGRADDDELADLPEPIESVPEESSEDS